MFSAVLIISFFEISIKIFRESEFCFAGLLNHRQESLLQNRKIADSGEKYWAWI